MKYFYSLLLLPFLVLLISDAESEDFYKTKEVSSYVMSSPGGSRIGELYQNAKLKELEKKGKWSKVSVEAWLETDELVEIAGSSSQNKKKDLSSIIKGDSSIIVTNYSIKRVSPLKSDASKLKRVIVSIEFQNKSAKEIKELNGFLVIRDKNQKLVLRTPVSSKKAVSANSSGNIKFAWNEEEDEYHSLLSYPNPNQAFEVNIAGTK